MRSVLFRFRLPAFLAFAGCCLAQVPAITSFSGGSLFPSIDATDRTVGFSFTANSNLTVTALGVWETDTSVALIQTHQVGLWTGTGTQLASATVLTNSPVNGSWRYVTISPVLLTAGQTYIAGSAVTNPYSDNYTRVPVSGGSVTTSPLITLGTSYSSPTASGFAFPNTPDVTYLGRFGPNLIVSAVPVSPAPPGWLLVGTGMAAMLLLLYARRRQQDA